MYIHICILKQSSNFHLRVSVLYCRSKKAITIQQAVGIYFTIPFKFFHLLKHLCNFQLQVPVFHVH